MLESILQTDTDLFLFLNNLGTETWDGFWMFVTNSKSSIPIYMLLLFLVYRKIGLKKTVLVLVSVGLLITVTDQLSNFFKYGVQRFRPCHNNDLDGLMRLVKSSCGGKYGYFSAHASNSFAVAVFFMLLLKKHFKYVGVLLLFWAALVAYSRIYVGVHYPLDILTGALLGSFFGWIFYRLTVKLESRV